MSREEAAKILYKCVLQEMLAKLRGLLSLHQPERRGLQTLQDLSEELHNGLSGRVGGEVERAAGERLLPRQALGRVVVVQSGRRNPLFGAVVSCCSVSLSCREQTLRWDGERHAAYIERNVTSNIQAE